MKKRITLGILASTGLLLAACGQNNSSQNPSQRETSMQSLAESIASNPGEENSERVEAYYTSNMGSVTKVDGQTHEVIDTIAINGSAHNVQISPDEKVIGVTVVPGEEHAEESEDSMGSESMGHDEESEASMDSESGHADEEGNGSAVFYDAETGEQRAEVEVGSHPAHIVFTEDNQYVLVSNNGDNTVTIIDAATYEVVGTIETGQGPHGFRIANNSNTAYVANMGEDTVSVLDIEKMEEVDRITVGEAPATTGITSDNTKLLATLSGENALAIVDLTTDKVTKVAVGNVPIQLYIQHDDQYAFVANEGTEDNPSHTVSQVDLNRKEVVETIEVGNGAHGVVTSEDDQYIFVTNAFDNTVSVIENETSAVIATVTVGEEPNGITVK